MLNHFYITGAYFWDSGLFAHFTTATKAWPMLWPDLLHRGVGFPPLSFFSIHFMPIFYLTSALQPGIPAAAYFSLLLGGATGLVGLSTYILCGGLSSKWALPTALATALSGPVLASVGFPHIELLIPGLLLMFFALRITKHRIGAYLALALCLLIREDAGLHAASLLFLMAVAIWLSGESQRLAKECLFLVVICVAYSLGSLALQNFVYPSGISQLERIYVGSPPGSHLSWQLLSDRLPTFFIANAYATWPAAFLLVVAAWKRDAILAVGPLAVVPWLLLSLFAVTGGALASYYAFPLVVTVAWPIVAWSFSRKGVLLQLATSVLSIILFVAFGVHNHDNAPWRKLVLPDLGAVGRYEAALREVVARRGELGRLMVDDAVASLIPSALVTDEWVAQWSVDHLPNPDVVVYLPGSSGSAETIAAIRASGLTHTCPIIGTPFVVATKTGASYCR